MSYILDALKKSEHERGHGSVPDVQTIHSSSLLYRKEKNRIWPYVLIAAVLLNVVVMSFYLFYHNNKPHHIYSAKSTTTQPQLAAESILKQSTNRQVDKPHPTTLARQTTAVKQPDTVVKPAEINRHLKAAKHKSPKPANDQVTANKRTVAPMLNNQSAPTRHRLKIIEQADLPAKIARSLPSIVISAHVYSKNPLQRSIVINNRYLEEGDYVIDDLKLYKITPDGAIFSYKGYRFHNRDVAGWQ